jgi:hypothetical protein
MYPDLRFIEAWLDTTNTPASKLSSIACGSPNYVSMMRGGKTVRQKHIKAMVEYIETHPEGIKRTARIYKAYGPRTTPKERVEGAGGPPCSSIPVLGPSSMTDQSMFHEIKNEAFKRGISIAHLMEQLLKMGWSQYIRKEAA